MADLPDRTEHQRRFMALDNAERRAIIRAVNRGQAVEVRKHAPLAVGVARRQQRFWRWAWLFGPSMVAVNIALVPIEVALLNGALVTLALGAASTFWFRRAKRAEALNLAIVGGKRSPRAASAAPAAAGAGTAGGSGPLAGLRSRFSRSGRSGGSGGSAGGSGSSGGGSSRSTGGHLPGERRRRAGSAATGDAGSAHGASATSATASDDATADAHDPQVAGTHGDTAPTMPGTRPYRPRGRKRR